MATPSDQGHIKKKNILATPCDQRHKKKNILATPHEQWHIKEKNILATPHDQWHNAEFVEKRFDLFLAKRIINYCLIIVSGLTAKADFHQQCQPLFLNNFLALHA